MKNSPRITLAVGALFALLFVRSSFAETYYYTDISQATAPAAWVFDTVWTTNTGGATNSGNTNLTAPAAGGIYNLVWNGINEINEGDASFAYIRTPGNANNVSFPGDSLVIGPGTQLRLKYYTLSATSALQGGLAGTTGVHACTNMTPTNSFPGNGGNAGLVLNGGMLTGGPLDPGACSVINGTISNAAGVTSYIFPGCVILFAGPIQHAINLAGQLSGSGTLVVFNGTNNVPTLQITGAGNTFAGEWLLQGGWLQGVGDGSNDGYNSLGTNSACSIVVNPNYNVPSGTNVSPTNFLLTGQILFNSLSLLDLGSSTMNSAGTLTLTNNGQMWMHGLYIFSAVTINGTPLANGYYSYSYLTNNFPGNFTGLPGVFTTFSGGIIVQPSGPIPNLIPPSISPQPANETACADLGAQFISGTSSGSQPIYYQWYTVDSTGTVFTPLTNGANISGAATTNLTLTNIPFSYATNYAMIASNNVATATSTVVSLTVVPVEILSQPVSDVCFTGDTVPFSAGAIGLAPLTCQWYTLDSSQTIYTRVANGAVGDGATNSGATNSTLTVANVTGPAAPEATNYVLVVTNSLGAATSAVVTLSVQGVTPATITFNYGGPPIIEALGAGNDWNESAAWWDGNGDGGLGASTLLAMSSQVQSGAIPFEVVDGAVLRSPFEASATNFPGTLIIDGYGTFVDSVAGGTATTGDSNGVLVLNGGPSLNPGSRGEVWFTNLIMNGGSIVGGNNGIQIMDGSITILSNTPFYNYSAAGADRGFQIDAVVSGAGGIEYVAEAGIGGYASTFTNSLWLTNNSNTFMGAWNILQGVVVASGSNSLGTNNIAVGTMGLSGSAGGILETMYNINSPNATLTIAGGGQMLLHQNDTFLNVSVNGQALAYGTYAWSVLNSQFPSAFPSNWLQKLGSTVSNASGSIMVVGQTPSIAPQPVSDLCFAGDTVIFNCSGTTGATTFQWYTVNNTVNAATNIYTPVTNGAAGDGATNYGATSNTLIIANVTNSPTAPEATNYVLVAGNRSGYSTSVVATLTVQAFTPTSITFNYGGSPVVELLAAEGDWNTTGNWWDGNYDGGLAASSLLAMSSQVQSGAIPFEVVDGAVLRTPYLAAATNFPGALIVDGVGTFVNASLGATGSPPNPNGALFLRGGPGTTSSSTGEVWFTNLIMNGGEIDGGQYGIAIVDGSITINSNTPIFNYAASQDRGIQIDAIVSGAGGIQYEAEYGTGYGYLLTYTNSLWLTNNSNTFTGPWNIDNGVVVGGAGNGLGPNTSLGTNSILIGPTGILETMYDMDSPDASLTITNGGQMYLHQNDTFGQVSVNGVVLTNGTWQFATLNSQFPSAFPAGWPSPKLGSTSNTASGSITVLSGPPVIYPEPVSTTNVIGGASQFITSAAGTPPLSYQWYTLNSAQTVYTPLTNGNPAEISGATNATLVISPVGSGDATNYVLIVTNTLGSATSSVASLVILTPVRLTTAYSGGTVTLTWAEGGSLLEAANLQGPWITNTSATSPWPVIPGANHQMFFKVVNVLP